MARNIKLKGRGKKTKEGYTVTIKLDPETTAIWNRRKNYENMSEWVRSQLLWHFKGELTQEQKALVLQEEYAILQMNKKKLLAKIAKDYDDAIFAKGRELSKLVYGVDVEHENH